MIKMENVQSDKKRKISLYINIALAVLLVGLMIWTLIPGPKVAVKNITIQVIDQYGAEMVCIDSKDYDSNKVEDILNANKTELGLEWEESEWGKYIKTFKNKTAGDSIGEHYWEFQINYQYANVGVTTYRVKDGDVIVFIFTEIIPWP